MIILFYHDLQLNIMYCIYIYRLCSRRKLSKQNIEEYKYISEKKKRFEFSTNLHRVRYIVIACHTFIDMSCHIRTSYAAITYIPGTSSNSVEDGALLPSRLCQKSEVINASIFSINKNFCCVFPKRPLLCLNSCIDMASLHQLHHTTSYHLTNTPSQLHSISLITIKRYSVHNIGTATQ